MNEFTREDFERNFNILKEQIISNKMRFCSDIDIEGLLRVRFAPNGRIDFLTVDESARLTANMMGWTLDERMFEKIDSDSEGDENKL